MGNCTDNMFERRKARSSFDFSNTKTDKVPLVFHIKTWPNKQGFDARDAENCLERSIDAPLYEGQHIQITLKSTLEGSFQQEKQNRLYFTLRCQISKKNKCFTIKFPLNQQKKFLWKFIGNWTFIEQGDIVKMGKTKYKLSKLVHQKQINVFKSLRNIDESLVDMSESHGDNRCRICLSSSDSLQNPLISPCKCTGSVKYTHLKCLSNWLFDMNIIENQAIKIRVNKSICELCKTDITGTPQYEKMTEILLGNANNIPTPYAIFQTFQKDEDKERNYFILCFDNKDSYSFGRSSKADVCDKNDKCISKINTVISYKSKRLMIKDCESTHGTFMKIREDLRLYASNLTENLLYRNMVIQACYIPLYDKL